MFQVEDLFWIWRFDFFLEMILLLRRVKLIAMWLCETEKIMESTTEVGCSSDSISFQAMKLIETAQGGGGWVLLSNCPLELRYVSDVMCGNSRERTCWGADYVYKLGVNEKKHIMKLLFFPCSRKMQ